MDLPLTGIKVLELARVLAGPWMGQILAELGAEVIKVEAPEGDETRGWGPPFASDGAAAYFHCCNRGKRSIALDFKNHDDLNIAKQLATNADILIENFKVGGLAKFGLDYAALARSNPALIYTSITGFGQTGPYAHRPGYDFIIQGLSGLMSVTGERDDLPGGGPQKVGVAVVDLMTGMYATIAVLAALAHRDQTGIGQYIDMALLDVSVAMLANMNMNYLTTGNTPKRWGNAHPNVIPYQVFACKEGHIILAVGNDSQFRKFCEVASDAALGVDERFATMNARIRNRDVLIPQIEKLMKQRSMEEWVTLLEAAGVPYGPINSIAQTFANPQVQARGLKVDVPHPLAGTTPQVASPMRLSATPVEYRNAPPTLGQHNEIILRDLLNMSSSEIANLQERKVI